MMQIKSIIKNAYKKIVKYLKNPKKNLKKLYVCVER